MPVIINTSRPLTTRQHSTLCPHHTANGIPGFDDATKPVRMKQARILLKLGTAMFVQVNALPNGVLTPLRD